MCTCENVSHAITCDEKHFSASDGLRVFANISPLISTTGINRGLDRVKCVKVLVRRSSPVCKLASTQKYPIEKPFKFRIRRSVTLYAECERYTGYSIHKAFVHSCVSRLIEQWDALLQYFQMAVQRDNLLVTKNFSLMQNPIWKLYYFFRFCAA